MLFFENKYISLLRSFNVKFLIFYIMEGDVLELIIGVVIAVISFLSGRFVRKPKK
jgi:hypothetical protein